LCLPGGVASDIRLDPKGFYVELDRARRGPVLTEEMLSAIDRDDRPGDVPGGIADQEGRQVADVGDVGQMMHRCPGSRLLQQAVEPVDTAGGAGADRAGRDRVDPNA